MSFVQGLGSRVYSSGFRLWSLAYLLCVCFKNLGGLGFHVRALGFVFFIIGFQRYVFKVRFLEL